jgi:large subunit ribosomal protein L4e
VAKKKLEETPLEGEPPVDEPEPKEAAGEEPEPEEEPKAEEEAEESAPKPKRARGRRAKQEAAKATKKPKPVRTPLAANEVHVYSLEGEVVKNVELPAVFRAPLRFDLIRRAVKAFRANRRQPYGPNRKAGMHHSVRWSGKGHGVSRVPRIRGTMIGAQAPGTVGGRKGHGPKPWADWSQKINAKERVKARNAALAALRQAEIVSRRGHRFDSERTLPIVVETTLEEQDEDDLTVVRGVQILRALGVYQDIERASRGTHIRAGRGKMRGRRYRTPRSVLLVASKPEGIARAFRNLPGVEVVGPSGLNAEVLAPGGDPGRLTIFTESALEALRGWAA